MSEKYDAKLEAPRQREYRSERTLEEITKVNPAISKLAQSAASDSPWKWNDKEILAEREKSIGTPLKETFESIREQQQTLTPFAETLTALRGQPTPARESVREPTTPITQYRSDYDKLYDQPGITPLKETTEAIRGKPESPESSESPGEMEHVRPISPGHERRAVYVGPGDTGDEGDNLTKIYNKAIQEHQERGEPRKTYDDHTR